MIEGRSIYSHLSSLIRGPYTDSLLSSHQPSDDPGNYASKKYFLGNRFLVIVPAAAVLGRGTFELRLDCEPEPGAESVTLAKSQLIRVTGDSSADPAKGAKIILRDISPTALNDEYRWTCPISLEQVKEPLMVNKLYIHDSEWFAQYLKQKAESGGSIIDMYSQPINVVHRVNKEAMRHRQNLHQRLQRQLEASEFPAIDLNRIETENNQLLDSVNLETAEIDGSALPILKEIWSNYAVKHQIKQATQDVRRQAQLRALRKVLLTTAARMTSMTTIHSAITVDTHYRGTPLTLRLFPRYYQLLRRTPFGALWKNAELDKPLSTKLIDAIKISVCIGLPLYSFRAAMDYLCLMRKLNPMVEEVQKKVRSQILKESMGYLMKPSDEKRSSE